MTLTIEVAFERHLDLAAAGPSSAAASGRGCPEIEELG